MKEYGGYLPLELRFGTPYYDYEETEMLKCNSGLTAIYCAVKNINPKRVFLPYFICDTVFDLIKKMNVDIKRYYISKDFEPIDISLNSSDCIILVNYFGICEKTINKLIINFPNVIIDNTQSFFTNPVFRKGVYNIYSCRKFVGTPDGAYLIGKNIDPIELQEDLSSYRSIFLFRQHEEGTNAAYEDEQKNYSIIKCERRHMSMLTEKLLKSVDYEYIKKARKDNFEKLNSLLKKYNRFSFPNRIDFIPYSYPFLLKIDIRQKLINRKVYVPTLWKERITEEFINKVEYDYSKNICHLPIDQRYNCEDMEEISKIVLDCLEV